MQPIQFSSGHLKYGALIVLGIVVDPLLVLAFDGHAHASTLAIVASSVLFILGLYGLIRPRLVTLDDQALTLRPTFGPQKRWTRQHIIDVEEIVSPPFGALIARVKDQNGKHRGITLSNRLALAGLGVRQDGREIGTTPSSRLSLMKTWLKDAL